MAALAAALEGVAVAGVSGTTAIRVYFLEISVKPAQICTKFNEIDVFSYFFYFYVYFRAGVLGHWCGSPAPKFWEGLPAPPKWPIQRPASHHFGGAGGDALIPSPRPRSLPHAPSCLDPQNIALLYLVLIF
jgi:hypothetical protein